MYTKMKFEKVQQIWFISILVWNPKDVIIIFYCNCKQLLIYFCVWRRIMFVGSLSFFFSRLSIEVNFNLIEVQSVFREVIDFLQVSRSLLRRNGIYLQNIWTFASNSNFTVWKINYFSAAIQILREINFEAIEIHKWPENILGMTVSKAKNMPKLISRKIWMAEKLVNFHTVN